MTPRKVGAILFGLVVLAIGIANMIFVHPVPGTVFVFLSLIYFPVTSEVSKRWTGFSIPLVFKVILGFAIIWFTLGISDLGDIIDKL
jgi:hypothetical protein